MSPPTHDEPFFHIRLPLMKRGKMSLDEQSTSIESNASSTSLSLETDIECGPFVDLSNECKKYIAGLENGMCALAMSFALSCNSVSLLQPLRPSFIAANRKVPMTISKRPHVLAHW